jgi:hypothetical protein
VKAKAEPTPEYVALETDEKRKEVFDRYIERLKVTFIASCPNLQDRIDSLV